MKNIVMISNDINNGCLKTEIMRWSSELGPQKEYLTSYTCLTLLSVFHQSEGPFLSPSVMFNNYTNFTHIIFYTHNSHNFLYT